MYLKISTPDGLIIYLHGSEVGRRSDINVYRQRRLGKSLRDTLVLDEEQYYIFGDAAFVLRPRLRVVFKRVFATGDEMNFNPAMNSAYATVEWVYKDTKQQFTTMNYRRILMDRKALISPTSTKSVLLWSVKVCLHGWGKLGELFPCNSPSIREYLAQILGTTSSYQ